MARHSAGVLLYKRTAGELHVLLAAHLQLLEGEERPRERRRGVVDEVGAPDPLHGSLLVLSIWAGSFFLSHANDAGFWLVKEYFGMSVGETLRTWSVMETAISVVGIALVLLIGLV